MHVPTLPTKDVSVMSFSDALKMAHEPQDYDEQKWLYVPPFYTEYRYILGTAGKDPLICIGINPSTAAPNSLDNTLKSVGRVAKNNGYDGFIMLNVYPQRATDPDDMENERNTYLHTQNLDAFEYALSLSESRAVWAAWGTIVERREYLISCMSDMVRIGKAWGARWLTAGKRSKAGHPHHPLYLKADSPLEDFDIDAYIDSMK